MERVKYVIDIDGTVKTEVLEHNGNCKEALRTSEGLGRVSNEEHFSDDCPTVHETTNG
jgi:hypothetical protein